MKVNFYIEKIAKKCGKAADSSVLLAKWECDSRETMLKNCIGMVVGARLRYKNFAIICKDDETGKILHVCKNFQ